jgi:hypothetical protein
MLLVKKHKLMNFITDRESELHNHQHIWKEVDDYRATLNSLNEVSDKDTPCLIS